MLRRAASCRLRQPKNGPRVPLIPAFQSSSAPNSMALLESFYAAGLSAGRLRVSSPLEQQLARALTAIALLDVQGTPGHRAAAVHLEHALALVLELPDAAPWVAHPSWKAFFLEPAAPPLAVPPGSMLFDGAPVSPSLIALLSALGFVDQREEGGRGTLVMPPREGGSRGLLEAAAQVLRDALLALVSRMAREALAGEARADLHDVVDALAGAAGPAPARVPLALKAAEALPRPGARLLRALGWAPPPAPPPGAGADAAAAAAAAAALYCAWAPASAEGRLAPEAYRAHALQLLRHGLLPARPLPPWPPARDYALQVVDLDAPPPLPAGGALPAGREGAAAAAAAAPPLREDARRCILQPFAGPCSLLAIANCILLSPGHRFCAAARRDVARAAAPTARALPPAASAGGGASASAASAPAEQPTHALRYEVRLSYVMSLVEELSGVAAAEAARLDAFLLRAGLMAPATAADRAARAAGAAQRAAHLLREACTAAAGAGVSLEDLHFDGTFPAHLPGVALFEAVGVALVHGWVAGAGSGSGSSSGGAGAGAAGALARSRVSHARLTALCAGGEGEGAEWGGWAGGARLPQGLGEEDLPALRAWVAAGEAFTPAGLAAVLGRLREGHFACLYKGGQ